MILIAYLYNCKIKIQTQIKSNQDADFHLPSEQEITLHRRIYTFILKAIWSDFRLKCGELDAAV